MNYDPECSYCAGTGWFLWHSPTCDDDLCALNGDEHSCEGELQACDCAAAPLSPNQNAHAPDSVGRDTTPAPPVPQRGAEGPLGPRGEGAL